MTVLLCSVFSILRYKEHRNILYLTWTGSSNPQLFRTGVISPGRKNSEFDLDLKFNLIYDLIFFGKKIFSPNVQKGVGSHFYLSKL